MAVTLTGLHGPDLHITDDDMLAIEVRDGALHLSLSQTPDLQSALVGQWKRQMECWDEVAQKMRDDYRFDLTITGEDGEQKTHLGVFIGQMDWEAFNHSDPEDVTIRVRILL